MPPSDAVTPQVQPRSRRTLAAVLLLLATLVCGGFLGAAIDRLILFRQHRILPVAGMHFAAARILSHLDRDLDLRPAQKQQIKGILDRRQVAIEEVWNGFQPKIREQIETTNREIEAVLDEKQKEKFREVRARWQNHSHRMFGPR